MIEEPSLNALTLRQLLNAIVASRHNRFKFIIKNYKTGVITGHMFMDLTADLEGQIFFLGDRRISAVYSEYTQWAPGNKKFIAFGSKVMSILRNRTMSPRFFKVLEYWMIHKPYKILLLLFGLHNVTFELFQYDYLDTWKAQVFPNNFLEKYKDEEFLKGRKEHLDELHAVIQEKKKELEALKAEMKKHNVNKLTGKEIIYTY